MRLKSKVYKNFYRSLRIIFCLFLSDTFLNINALDSKFLKCNGTSLVNQNGETVILSGVNIGGWLIQENWMCPICGGDTTWANLNTLNILEKRFGAEKTQELFDIYQENWITKKDIKNIADKGCNVIRVPFWYRNFMTDINGTWINNSDSDNNPRLMKLDWIIDEAKKNNMYVILDMHGCPGGQSLEHTTGTLEKNFLYSDPVCQDTMELLWKTIAKRYKDNPTVAAYNIMNEPNVSYRFGCKNKYNPFSSKTYKMVHSVYDRMIKAIREVDKDHIITVEFIILPGSLPDPKEMNWDNIMYQAHYYFPHPACPVEFGFVFSFYLNRILSKTDRYNVPAYIGEFKYLDGINI